MASYANKKVRLFRDAGDAELVKKRSENRLKTYFSATDARAWSGELEERRQHILEIIRADAAKGISIGKYVPIDVLIDTLLANKNADIERLKKQVDELQKLLEMYEKLNLTEDQKKQLAAMRSGMGKLGEDLDTMASRTGSKFYGMSDTDDGDLTTTMSEGGTSSQRTGGDTTGGEYGEFAAYSADKSGGETTDMSRSSDKKGLRPIDELTEKSSTARSLATTSVTGSERSKCSAMRNKEDQFDIVGYSSDEPGSGCSALKRQEREARERALDAAGTSDERDQSPAAEDPGAQATGSRPRVTVPETCSTLSTRAGDLNAAAPDQQAAAGSSFYENDELKDQIINKDAEIISLKNSLCACQAEYEEQKRIAAAAMEQLENVKTMREVDAPTSNSQAQKSSSSHTGKDPCGADEIAALEAEIEMLRSQGMLTPEQEAEVIRKEVEVLKKYCAKLANIQEENVKLKAENEMLRKTLQEGGGEQLMAENDRLQRHIKELENESQETDESKNLDKILMERDALQLQLEELKSLELERADLKTKADRADALERQLRSLENDAQQSRRMSDTISRDMVSARSDCELLRRKNVELSNSLAAAEKELDRLRYRMKEADVLRVERDRLKVRLDELAAIEVEFMDLLEKTRSLETIKADRDMYKKKYEELKDMEMECDMLKSQAERGKAALIERDALQRLVRDCECCIADQEDEIKKLISHIDRLTQGRDDQQGRMKEALGSMRAELEEKNSLIMASEEQLASLQDQLQSTIAAVSAETSQLKARVEELEKQLGEMQKRLAEKQDEINYLHGLIEEKDELISNVSAERKASLELANAAQSKDEAIAILKKEIDALKLENKDLENTISALKDELASNNELGKTVTMLEQKLSDYDEMQQTMCAYQKQLQEAEKVRLENEELQDTVSKIKTKLEETESINAVLQVNAEQMKNQLEQAETDNANLQVIASKAGSLANDEHLQQMMEQSKGAVKRVAEELRKQCENWKCNTALKMTTGDVMSLDAEKQINELKDKLKKCQETIEKMREGAAGSERMLAENTALRRHSTEVQEVAKEQIQELVEHLKKAKDRIAELEAENEKLREAGSSAMKNLRELRTSLDQAVPASGSCEELKNQLEVVQSEKEKLQRLILEMQESAGDGGADQALMQLKADYAALENQLQKEIGLRKAAEEELQSMKDRLDGSALEVEKELENVLAKNSDLIKEKDALQKQIDELLQELESAKKSLTDDSAAAQQEDLKKQLEDQRKELEDLKKSSGKEEDLRKQLEEQNKELENLKKSSGKEEDLLKQLEEKNKELENMKKSSGKEEDLRKQLEEQKKELENLKTKSGSTSAREEQQLKTIADQKNEINNLKKQIDDLKKQVEDKKKEMEAVVKSAEGTLSAEQAALMKQIEDQKKELEQLKQVGNKQDDVLKELEAKEKELAKLRTECSTASEREQQRLKEIEDQKNEIDKLNKQIEDLKQQTENLKKQAENMKKGVDGDAKLLEETLNKQIDDLKKEIEDKKKEIENHQKMIDDLNKKLTVATAEDNKQQQLIDDLKKQIEDQKKEIEDLLEKMKTSSGDAGMLAKEMEEKQALQNVIDELQEQLKSLGAGQDAQRSAEKNEFEQTLKDLTAQLEAAERKAQAAENSLEAYKNSMSGDAVAEASKAEAYIKEIAELKDRVAELEAELEKAKAATAAGDSGLEDKIRQLEDELAKSKQASAEMEMELQRSKDNVKQLMGEMNLSEDDQEMINKMKEAYEQQINELSAELHKLKTECTETIATLKAQYDRDIKNVHNKHDDGISRLQSSHEEILQDIHSEHEKEVDSLRLQLQTCKEKLDSLQKQLGGEKTEPVLSSTTMPSVDIKSKCTCSGEHPKTKGVSTKEEILSTGTDDKTLDDILNKILSSGFESLNFDELQYMHTKTCDATAGLLKRRQLEEDADVAEQEYPPMDQTFPKDPDKMTLMKRIAMLEGDLLKKQKLAQQKVAALQIAVRLERQRLEELKRTLDIEKKRNNELVSKIGSQTKAVANLQVERDMMRRQSSYHEEKLQQFIVSVEQERGRIRSLEDDLQKERNNVRHMQNLLETERDRARQKIRKDSEVMESMRVRLEQTLNSEMVLRMQLEQHTRPRHQSQQNTGPSRNNNAPLTPFTPSVGVSPTPTGNLGVRPPKTTTFYTELTVQDVKNKQNFVHHCSIRNLDSGRVNPDYEKSSHTSSTE